MALAVRPTCWLARNRLVLARLNNQGVFVCCTVGIKQGLFVVCMEEVFRAEVLQVLVNPVQQAFVALGNSRSDGVGVAQLLNADNVFGASLVGKGDNLGVVIRPNSIGVVFECGLSCGVGVVLLELEVLVVLGKVGLGSGAGDYDYRAVANLVEVGNNLVLVGNNAQATFM